LPASDAPRDPFFGASTHFRRTDWSFELMDLMDRAGMANLRDQQLWRLVEETTGEYTFTTPYVRTVDRADRHGFDTLLILAYSNPIHVRNHSFHRPPHTDAGRQAFARYAVAVVERYPSADAVEIWNEPDHESFSKGAPAETFARLQGATAPAIRETRPDVTIVGGSMNHISPDWVRAFLDAGALEHLDALSVHPYRDTPTGFDRDVDRLRSIMANHGTAKPIWVTEFGWRTARGDSATPITTTPNTQAAYIARSHSRLRAADVERAFWYTFVDDGVETGQWGLLRHPEDPMGRYSPKPGYVGYATTTRRIGAATDEETEISVPAGVASDAFRRNGTTTRVLWSTTGRDGTVTQDPGTPVTLSVAGAVTVTTTMGQRRTLHPHDGEVYLDLSGDPLFLTGPVTGISRGAPVDLDATVGVAGERVPLGLHSSLADPVTFRVAGERFEVSGERRSVDGPGNYVTGPARIAGTVAIDGQTVGFLRTNATIRGGQIRTRVSSTIDASGSALELSLQPVLRSDEPATLTSVEWTVGDETRRRSIDRTVTADGSTALTLPAAPAAFWRPTAATVTLEFARREPLELNETVSFNPTVRSEHTIDARLEEVEDRPAPTLPADGGVRIDDYGGSGDVSGPIWISWNDDHLVLSARITDDVHASGYPLWEYDSVQLGVTGDRPGNRRNFSEFQIGLTPDGPAVYRRYQPEGKQTTAISAAEAAIERRDGTTVYEVAIPWDVMARTSPDGPVSVSLLVNDNDGEGREGWIEWAGGIGSGKDATQFRRIQLVDTVPDPTPSGNDTAAAPDPGADPGRTNTTAPAPRPLLAIVTIGLVTLLARRRR
jgi:hypothetical protein